MGFTGGCLQGPTPSWTPGPFLRLRSLQWLVESLLGAQCWLLSCTAQEPAAALASMGSAGVDPSAHSFRSLAPFPPPAPLALGLLGHREILFTF